MTYTIETQTIIFATLALIIGLVLGWTLRGNKRRKIAGLEAQIAHVTGERDAVTAERDRLLTDLDTARSQIRPLSDEVDKLRRAATKRDALTTAPVETVAAAEPPLSLSSDNLMQLKGVGDKFAAKLGALGITQIRQIAAWSSADVAVIDSQLGPFQGRIMRDRLVEQAKLLNEGRITEYETRFGKLGDPAP